MTGTAPVAVIAELLADSVLLSPIRQSATGAAWRRSRGLLTEEKAPHACPHCTFAATDALLFNVKVQVFVLLPLLEQAPDQTASRLFETLNVIDVPVANDADPVPPTAPSALKASS